MEHQGPEKRVRLSLFRGAALLTAVLTSLTAGLLAYGWSWRGLGGPGETTPLTAHFATLAMGLFLLSLNWSKAARSLHGRLVLAFMLYAVAALVAWPNLSASLALLTAYTQENIWVLALSLPGMLGFVGFFVVPTPLLTTAYPQKDVSGLNDDGTPVPRPATTLRRGVLNAGQSAFALVLVIGMLAMVLIYDDALRRLIFDNQFSGWAEEARTLLALVDSLDVYVMSVAGVVGAVTLGEGLLRAAHQHRLLRQASRADPAVPEDDASATMSAQPAAHGFSKLKVIRAPTQRKPPRPASRWTLIPLLAGILFLIPITIVVFMTMAAR